jgi:uncharacterized damage-inducible protein DinB
MLRKSIIDSLQQLELIFDLMNALPDQETKNIFSRTSVGRHFRHIYDHFIAFEKGLEAGVVDYNKRNRESLIELDPHASARQLSILIQSFSQLDLKNNPLKVLSEIDCFVTESTKIDSNTHRELLYLINHSIHHAAHIKLLLQLNGIELPDLIGLAPSTASYLRSNQSA